MMQHTRRTGAIADQLHRQAHMASAQQRLTQLLVELLQEAAAAGQVRADVVPEELAGYCLHALAGAGELPSEAAVGRLVHITLDGLLVRQ
jgi:hypothetical protein